MFSVLIVDDTLFYRSLLKSLLKDMKEFEVTATAGTGDRALEILETHPAARRLLFEPQPQSGRWLPQSPGHGSGER